MTRMSPRNLTSTPVLSAVVVSGETPSYAHSHSQSMLWVHKKCIGITKQLVEDWNYICSRCKGESWPIDGQTVTEVDVYGTMLDVEATFCYLGDMLCSCGGCDSAIAAKCRVAWGQFRKLLPVLTSRHLSPRIHGVRSAMLHGGETWEPKEPELQQLRRNDCVIGSVASKTETKHPQLHYDRNLLDIKDVTSVLRRWRLRWYGHVQLATSFIKSITNFQIPGTRKKGRPRKTWSECVKTDVNNCGLAGIDPLDRDAWRAGVRHSLVLPTP